MPFSSLYKLAFDRAASALLLFRIPADPEEPIGQGSLLHANRAAKLLFDAEEIEPEEFAGRVIDCVPDLTIAHRRLEFEENSDLEAGYARLAVSDECLSLVGEAKATRLDGEHFLLQLESSQSNELEQLREKLRQSVEKYRQVVDNANDAIYLFELNTAGRPARILEVNEVACRRLGYTREEYLVMDPTQMDDPSETPEIEASMERLRAQRTETIEMSHVAKDGTAIPVEVSSHLFDSGGRTYHLAIVRDIRERKEAERRVLASLEEKTVLLREIHHRVKNNMQLISSLLSLQAQSLADPRLLDIFTEAQNRVGALALVHEKLYQATDLARVDFEHYAGDLVKTLRDGLYTPGRSIDVSIETESVSLPVPVLIPIALILSELVSNAFKHAFAPFDSGQIAVVLQRKERQLELSVCDDGVGLPEEFDGRALKSLGWRLVETLVEQLEAELHVETPFENDGTPGKEELRRGTRIRVTFTPPEHLP